MIREAWSGDIRLEISTVRSGKNHHASSLVLSYFWVLEETPPFLEPLSTVELVFRALDVFSTFLPKAVRVKPQPLRTDTTAV